MRREMRIAVRTSAAPEIIANDLHRAVWSLDPQLAVAHVQTMQEAISNTEAPRRFNTFVIAAFALAAVLLSTLGIYGIIAFSVAQRVREIAVRMAVAVKTGERRNCRREYRRSCTRICMKVDTYQRRKRFKKNGNSPRRATENHEEVGARMGNGWGAANGP